MVGVVFDLDDTLYLERGYVRSGFWAVAAEVAGRTEHPQSDVFRALWCGFVRGVRVGSLDALVTELDLSEQLSVAELLSVYRTHEPRIGLMGGVAPLLIELRARGARLGVISDGRAAGQRLKVQALDVAHLVDQVILTDDLGREYWKPHDRAFVEMSDRLGVPHQRLVYVADNPVKDFIGPRVLGWRTVRLQTAGQLHRDAPSRAGDEPTAVVSSVGALAVLLLGWAAAGSSPTE